jgi:hypothetical protein
MFLTEIFIFLYKNTMAKAVAHIHSQTQHKDRLVLVGLVAVLAFTVVNTVLQFTQIALNDASLHVLY